jgi:hypothetical protein
MRRRSTSSVRRCAAREGALPNRTPKTGRPPAGTACRGRGPAAPPSPPPPPRSSLRPGLRAGRRCPSHQRRAAAAAAAPLAPPPGRQVHDGVRPAPHRGAEHQAAQGHRLLPGPPPHRGALGGGVARRAPAGRARAAPRTCREACCQLTAPGRARTGRRAFPPPSPRCGPAGPARPWPAHQDQRAHAQGERPRAAHGRPRLRPGRPCTRLVCGGCVREACPPSRCARPPPVPPPAFCPRDRQGKPKTVAGKKK